MKKPYKNINDTPYSLQKMNEFRQEQGLRVIVRGKRKCMRCEKEFYSLNVNIHRMCDYCRSLSET